MLVKTAVLCAIEVVIVALLAMQVFAARTASPADPGPAAAQPATVPLPAAIQTSASPSPDALPAGNTEGPAVERREASAKWNAEDPVGVLLTGVVRSRDGKPADVRIGAVRDKLRLGTSTVADGSYAVVGLQPGEWTLTVSGTAIVEASRTVTITDEAVQRHDFVVDPSFPVKVLIVPPDGADATTALRKVLLGMVDFTVTGQRDRFPDRFAPTDYGMVFVGDAKWDGQMNPKDGHAGTLHLASLPAHVAVLQRHLLLDQQVVQPGQTEVKFVVDIAALERLAGSATIRVLDAITGQPLTSARVSLATSNHAGMGRPVDAEGRMVVTGLSPGLLRLQIDAPEHETMYTTVIVAPSQRLDLGDVRLGARAPLVGTVLDADGKPATASLSWTELKWRAAPTAFATNRSARTEADGTFSLWGTGAGAIAVTARDADRNLACGVFDNPPRQPIVLRLAKPGTCVVTRPPDPTRGFTITLYDDSRRAIAAHDLEARVADKHTIAMPAGDYTFEVHDDQQRLVQSGTLTFGVTPCAVEIR